MICCETFGISLRMIGSSVAALRKSCHSDVLRMALGSAVSVTLIYLLDAKLFLPDLVPSLIAPMTASAVHLFMTPESAMVRSWSIVCGHLVFIIVGVAIAGIVSLPVLAAGLAVSTAMLFMWLSKSVHPSTGMTALVSVLGGSAVAATDNSYLILAFVINTTFVAVIAFVLRRVGFGLLPKLKQPISNCAPTRIANYPAQEDIDAAIAEVGKPTGITWVELGSLIERVARHAAQRQKNG